MASHMATTSSSNTGLSLRLSRPAIPHIQTPLHCRDLFIRYQSQCQNAIQPLSDAPQPKRGTGVPITLKIRQRSGTPIPRLLCAAYSALRLASTLHDQVRMERSIDYPIIGAAPRRWRREAPAVVVTEGPKIAFKLLILFLLVLYSNVSVIYQLDAYRPALVIAMAALGMMVLELVQLR